ncbi:MAG: HigA family addiction module antidote protein [Xanthomonadales bacterium]|nr:HigA family addiction module antidote protein [Xanthomonadales bacterium]
MSIPATTNGLPAIHPGYYLREILEDLGMSQAAFARSVGVSRMRISHVAREARPVTAELALRFGLAFGQTAQYWINLQNAYDLKLAEREWKAELRKVRPLAAGTLRPRRFSAGSG